MNNANAAIYERILKKADENEGENCIELYRMNKTICHRPNNRLTTVISVKRKMLITSKLQLGTIKFTNGNSIHRNSILRGLLNFLRILIGYSWKCAIYYLPFNSDIKLRLKQRKLKSLKI